MATESPQSQMSTVKREPTAPRVLELLAPRFSGLSVVSGSIPVSLDLSASLDVQLVFWEHSITREIECVNVDEGCPRCKFESFLRGLVILKRRGLLHINGAYVVDEKETDCARLRLQVEGQDAVAAALMLEEFKFVKSHLQTSYAANTTQTKEQLVDAAKRSACHVVGCNLHRWKTPRTDLKVAAPVQTPTPAPAPIPVTPVRVRTPVPDPYVPAKVHTPVAASARLQVQIPALAKPPSRVLPPTASSFIRSASPDNQSPVQTEGEVQDPASPVVEEESSSDSDSAASAAEVESSSDSDSAESFEVEGQELTEPPANRKLNLPDVFYSLMARIEANPTDLWSANIPGLDLKLYEHQRRGLSWMIKREEASLWDTALPHPFSVPGKRSGQSERSLEEEFSATARDACGGMLCDEPGLGKTITMLALILLTKGQSTKERPVRADAPNSNTANVHLRSLGGRSLQAEDLVSSRASLIVVPDALVEHWEEQIEAHVERHGLKTFVDRATKVQTDLPKNTKLAEYDVVITSFARMTKEWKLHRPPTALEKQSILRYGFEDQPDRYLDGSLRGNVSSLLSVNWLRVIVDEGHKLGGRAPTQLMQMSRLLCAERRWVMTGTPSPNTLQSADLQYIHGLLVFLRNQPYGRPDGHAWSKAIARPFERNEVIAFYRLQHLLSRIMIRHTKESIREELPSPIRHTVIVNPTPSEFKLYNAVAERVRANLVATSIDYRGQAKKQRGAQDTVHPNSLLHSKSRQIVGYVESDLMLSFMGGYAVDWSVKKERMEKTIAKLNEFGVNKARVAEVEAYLNAIKLAKTTKCSDCEVEKRFLMVLPCGHLCCAFCVQDLRKELGECVCNLCNAPYDEDEFDYLQPTRTGEITEQGRQNTLSKLRASGVSLSLIEGVVKYMDTLASKPTTQCKSCQRELHLLLILWCGHFCCPDCVEKRFNESGPSCCLCHMEYSRKGFYHLQPGIYPTALEEEDKVGKRKKLVTDKKRKKPTQSAKKTRRLVNYKRDFWKIESSKIFYMATRIRELKKNLDQLPRGQALKVIIFSQYRESIWRTKVAFNQQNIPTADFIALVNPQQRIKNLKRFRSNPSLNVLLLSSLGSHGLDLSFVTHIFLLEEIWDKSVEMQVISRAHRMGARASVVVEQLWMRGTVECQLTSMNNQLFKSDRPTEDREATDQPTREEVQEASSADKGSFQQMKYNYILNNLRVLRDAICGKANEVRFSVVNERETVIRQGVHTISESGHVTTVSTKPTSTPVVRSAPTSVPVSARNNIAASTRPASAAALKTTPVSAPRSNVTKPISTAPALKTIPSVSASAPAVRNATSSVPVSARSNIVTSARPASAAALKTTPVSAPRNNVTKPISTAPALKTIPSVSASAPAVRNATSSVPVSARSNTAALARPPPAAAVKTTPVSAPRNNVTKPISTAPALKTIPSVSASAPAVRNATSSVPVSARSNIVTSARPASAAAVKTTPVSAPRNNVTKPISTAPALKPIPAVSASVPVVKNATSSAARSNIAASTRPASAAAVKTTPVSAPRSNVAVSTKPISPAPALNTIPSASASAPVSKTAATRTLQWKPSSPEVIVIDASSSDEDDEHDIQELLRKARRLIPPVTVKQEQVSVDEETESE